MFYFEILEKMIVSFAYYRDKMFPVEREGPMPMMKLLE